MKALEGSRRGSVRARGVLLLGVPGVGKSAFAKALGNQTGRPTLVLDVGSLMGSLVGQTEERTRQALKIADAMAPCILFVDEIEKALSGSQSSGQTDSGVSARLLGTLLSWLNDHESDVFVVATANDVIEAAAGTDPCRAVRRHLLPRPARPGGEGRDLADVHQEVRAEDRPASPPDRDWTPAEIKATCRLAALLDDSVHHAAQYIVPIAVTAGESVETAAELGFRSVPGGGSARHLHPRLGRLEPARSPVEPRPSRGIEQRGCKECPYPIGRGETIEADEQPRRSADMSVHTLLEEPRQPQPTPPGRPPRASGRAWRRSGSASPGWARGSPCPPTSVPRLPSRSTPRGSTSRRGRSCSTRAIPAFKAVTAIRSKITSTWKSMSLPFPEPGVRLIRRDQIEEFVSLLEAYRGELADAVANLDRHYEELKATAAERLGRLFNPADYPASLVGLFEVAWDFPSVEPPDYLRDLNPALYEAERARVAARFDEAVQMAEQAFLEEFAKLVGHLTERIAGGADGERKVFRDSAIGNLHGVLRAVQVAERRQQRPA